MNARGQIPPAPIAIFAYNRIDLLEQTLRALERCDGFRGSPLHVFSDGPRPDRPGDDDAVARVRRWIRQWAEEHDATVHESAANRGLRASIVSGVSELLETSDRIIVLEDDIVPSRTFLTFMNEGLAACESRDDIYQISGYFVPHRVDLPDLGLLRVPACWGWATWRRAWSHYRDDAAELVDALAAHDRRKFDIDGTYDYMESLQKNARGEANTWFVRWYAAVFLRGGLTVYPARSLARNVGFVEGGTNCGPGRTAQTFLRQRIDHRRKNFAWDALGTNESAEYAEVLAEFYRWQQHEWTRPTWRERVDARVKLLMGRGR